MVGNDKDSAEFYSRLDDIRDRAAKGEIGISAFLTEGEVSRADQYLKSCGMTYFFFGGYGEAERKRLYILPDYMEYTDGGEDKLFEEYELSSKIVALLISGSGYANLTHRDYLGSLLGLGIERSVMGDIVLLGTEESSAVLFCDERISVFILNDLERVGRDKVRIKKVDPESLSLPPRRFLHISTTVSSLRLDCVVAALCNLSRDKASALITGKSVDVEFITEEKIDRNLTPPCVISARGFGKYRLLNADTRTKKGKIRLEAKKYL